MTPVSAAASTVGSGHVAKARALCVDLDGSLLATDLFWETLLILLRTRPLLLLCLPFWRLRGKAFVKSEVARRVVLNPSVLPYNEAVLALLVTARRQGRPIVLATAADQRLASEVARHLGLFTAVLASDGRVNLKGRAKLAAIRRQLGGAPFDYIGNAWADLCIWRHAVRAILVRPSRLLSLCARRLAAVDEIVRAPLSMLGTLGRTLRVHQWTKNALLFLPLLLAHQAADLDRLVGALLALVAFCLAASAAYIVNDLFDLEADRRHPDKRGRPFADGLLPVPLGLLMASLAMVGSFALSLAALPPLFTGLLSLYLVATMAYSLLFKRFAILDVLLLASLYTLRVVAGATATDVPVSPWFLAFSMFFFLSLAFAKRYTELVLAARERPGPSFLAARGYLIGDLDLVRSVGTTSGYLSVAILALYISSPDVHILYSRPSFLWLIGPLLLYWITRVWLIAQRGQLPGDPVVFALSDRTSYVLAGLTACVMVAASLG
jgi:4-hydroxybenzoate polyprenyltransferase